MKRAIDTVSLWVGRPWYSAPPQSREVLLTGRRIGMMHIVCYLREDAKVFETYWTTIRGVEAADNSYRLLDLTVYGRQEEWEDSPPAWLKGKKLYPKQRASNAAMGAVGGRKL